MFGFVFQKLEICIQIDLEENTICLGRVKQALGLFLGIFNYVNVYSNRGKYH